jgi:peptidyl-prolyl cis-trans isomerase SurA
MRHHVVLLGMAACGLALSSCRKAPPTNLAATVNGRPITYAELDKQLQLQFAGAQDQPAGEDQLAIQKLEVLGAMVDGEIMLQRAEKQSLMATDADVDAKLNELRAGYTQEEFQKQLAMRKMSLDDLKAQIRRDLSVNKLINKEITSHIAISDKDIAEFYAANRDRFNVAEPQLHLAQIVVTPTPDPVRNLKNDNAITDDAARTKAKTLEARARQGEDFDLLARNFSEDPQSAATGGDMGFVPETNIQKLSPDLHKLLVSLSPGQISNALKLGPDYRLFKVIAKVPAGQRELNDPNVQQGIRETLMNRKDQLLRRAYYEVARNEAKVENYLAQSIVQAKAAKK